MSVGDYTKIATVRTVEAFRELLEELGADIPVDDTVLAAPESPLARPIDLFGEWDGEQLHPLSARVEGRFHPLGGPS